MPRVLHNGTGTVSLTNLEYLNLMKMLHRSGWRPSGTLAPAGWKPRRRKDGTPGKWPRMNYFSRLGQTVTETDAAAMADVLEAILPDVPEHDAFGHKVNQVIDLPYRRAVRLPRPGVRYNAFEFFSGENRGLLTEFVKLCRAGEFQIT